MLDEAGLKRALSKKGLVKHFALLKSLARESAYLELVAQADQTIPVAASMIGGYPDLPTEVDWFYRPDGTPLAFLGQINLRHLRPLRLPYPVPPDGLLSFFYDSENYPMGFDPADRGGHRVFYFDGDTSSLSRRYKPGARVEARASVYESTAVTFRKGLSLPVDYHLLDDAESSRIYVEEIANPEIEVNKMFGYPNLLQDEMELECELVTNGIDCGDETALLRPDIREFRERSQNWLLLLQLDSNDANDMRWGDSGRLFFWIRKQDLQEGRFDSTWAVLQSC